MRRLKLRLLHWLPRHLPFVEVVFVVACALVVSSQSAYAADVVRLDDRSMVVNNPEPGATTDMKISFIYTTPAAIGSVEILFCINPIPDEPCNKPVGFDASGAVLQQQTGEAGYTISFRSANRIVLTRVPTMTGNTLSTYRFSGIVNPSSMARSYAARLSTHLSTNASDPLPYVNLGSVLQQTNRGINFETQVPPILTFCLGQEVSIDCEELTGGNYTDMGNLAADQTLMASSQMAVGTNAPGGFVITANGTTMQSGTNVIKNNSRPTPSIPGTAQFGLNLRSNSAPEVGSDPDGTWVVANPTADYSIPNQFTFNDGDAVASSPDVALSRRFTVSYIVNAPENLRPGVYTTSLTYICSGRF